VLRYCQQNCKRATISRRARLDTPGTLHHVMLRGIERRRIVEDVAERKKFDPTYGKAINRYQNHNLCLVTDEQSCPAFLRSSEISLSGFTEK